MNQSMLLNILFIGVSPKPLSSALPLNESVYTSHFHPTLCFFLNHVTHRLEIATRGIFYEGAMQTLLTII